MSAVRWQGGKGGKIVRWHCRRDGKVVRWQFGKGGRVVRWQGRKDGRVVRWEGGRFLLSFKGEGCRVRQDFIFLFLMLINKTKEQDVFKIFLHGHRNGKILLRSNTSCKKCGRVWECFKFVNSDWFNVKIIWPYNLNLEQEMKNLACGYQWILLVVTRLVRRRVETEEINY